MDIPLPGMCPGLALGKRLGLGREEADYPRELDDFPTHPRQEEWFLRIYKDFGTFKSATKKASQEVFQK